MKTSIIERALLISLILGAWPVRGEIIDRVAAVVGRLPITRSEVQKEARLEAFFSHRPAPSARLSAADADSRAVLERLIRQRLIRYEMEQTQFPSADDAQVEKWLREQGVTLAAAPDYGLTEQDLADYGRRQIDILRFVDLRFKSGVEIPAQQVDAYYEHTLLPELARRAVAERPPLDQVRGQIKQILVEEQTNELLDNWLAELRTHMLVRVMEIEQP
ncbi:MAG: hypothetical protein HY236_07175 [Acidobacteria bacterium]|nr:hypothetical protein [Acidobacteriota bacterium]